MRARQAATNGNLKYEAALKPCSVGCSKLPKIANTGRTTKRHGWTPAQQNNAPPSARRGSPYAAAQNRKLKCRRLLRPRLAYRATNGAQLIDVALDVFAERIRSNHNGRHCPTCGGLQTALYQHFANKRDLFFTLIDSQLDTLRNRITSAIQTVDPDSPTADEDIAYRAVHGVFEFTANPRGHYRLLLDTSMDNPNELEERVEHFLSELVEFVSPYILDNSILDVDCSRFITRGIASSVLFMATRWAEEYCGQTATHPNIPLDTAVEHTCRFVAYGSIGFDVSNHPPA